MSGSEEDDAALVGTTVGAKYRIDRLIGRGGMGAVYQATNKTIGKRVALKFLDREAARDLDAVLRFQREAEAASAVESAHIVHIFDSGTHDDRPFLVMELLSGEDLRARLRREGRLPLTEVVHIAGQVLKALARAHAEGIVHRDLKPDNIFLCQRDDDPMFVKIVDFGISKVAKKTITADTLTRRGVVLGTAFYMSPEQAQAFRDIDGRTDLYSLGAILYECLAGRPPHIGSAYEAVLIDICTKNAEDIRKHAPDVPEAMALVIAKALDRDRATRFQTAEELYDALALATPGLLRTTGPFPRGTQASRPDTLTSTPPVAQAAPAAGAGAGDKPLVVNTGSGTAVGAGRSDSRNATRRTIVTAVVAALGAFALTVFLMAKNQSDARPAPTAGSVRAAATTPPPPSASEAEPLIAPVDSAEPAPPPSAEPSAKPTPTGKHVATHATHKAPPDPTTKPTAKPTGTGKTGGVASGLQLDTRGP